MPGGFGRNGDGRAHAGGRGPRGAGRGHGRGRGRAGWEAAGTLDAVRSGDEFEIACIDDETARVTALRFGIAEGSRVSCVTKIPAGPVVLRSGRQEIAVGRGLARRICIRPCAECGREAN